MTTLELRISTQKSRIAELENSIALSNETNDKVREDYLMLKDKFARLKHDVSTNFHVNHELI